MRDADLGANLKKLGSPTSAFVDRLRESDKRVVAIIDEVDVLENDTTLQALIDIPNVTIVAITIDEDDLFAHLDSRVRSRLRSAETITLDRFAHAQLIDILQARIRAGLRLGTITTDAIGYIADVAAGGTLARRLESSGVRHGPSRGIATAHRSPRMSSTKSVQRRSRRSISSASRIWGRTNGCSTISLRLRARFQVQSCTMHTSNGHRIRRQKAPDGGTSRTSRRSTD